MNRKFLALIFVVAISLFLALILFKNPFGTSISKAKADAIVQKGSPKPKVNKKTTTPSDTLSFIGVGDIMMGTDYPSTTFLAPDSAKHSFDNLKTYLQEADVTFGNLECVLQNGGTPRPSKPCPIPEKCYLFHSPTYYVKNLVNAGFDVMSIANNHANDYGEEGRASTVKTLKEAGLNFAGVAEHPYVIFEKNGLKIGFAAFAPNVGVMDLLKMQRNLGIVKKLDSLCDIVLISFHGGAEGEAHQHIPFAEEFYTGHSRGNVYQWAHQVIDAGADIVFGHGPHVTRAVELYKDRFIAYSLGNFCTPMRMNLTGSGAFAPMMKVYVDKKGRFIKGQAIPIAQKYFTPPIVDPKKQAVTRLKTLTQADFPKGRLNIDDDGNITIKK